MDEYESSKGLRSAIELATEEWRASASLRALKRQIHDRIVKAASQGERSTFVDLPSVGTPAHDVIQVWLVQAACSLDFVPGDRPTDHGSWRVRW